MVSHVFASPKFEEHAEVNLIDSPGHVDFTSEVWVTTVNAKVYLQMDEVLYRFHFIWNEQILVQFT